MTLIKILTVTGLVFDIVGAYLLAKGVFFETTKVLVDTSGIRPYQYDMTSKVMRTYTDAASRIVDRCKEIFQTRIGLYLIITGFILQIISQFLPAQYVISTSKMILLAIIFMLLVGSLWLMAADRDEKLKQDALIELVDRMIPNSSEGSLNLPAGMSFSEIERVCNILLKKVPSFEKFDIKPKKEDMTRYAWLVLERARRKI